MSRDKRVEKTCMYIKYRNPNCHNCKKKLMPEWIDCIAIYDTMNLEEKENE